MEQTSRGVQPDRRNCLQKRKTVLSSLGVAGRVDQDPQIPEVWVLTFLMWQHISRHRPTHTPLLAHLPLPRRRGRCLDSGCSVLLKAQRQEKLCCQRDTTRFVLSSPSTFHPPLVEGLDTEGCDVTVSPVSVRDNTRSYHCKSYFKKSEAGQQLPLSHVPLPC